MKEKTDFIGTWEEYKQRMKEKTDFIATLEEYKQLFTNFFCDPKPRSVKVTRNFDIVEELVLLNSRDLRRFTLEKNKFQIDASVNFTINSISLCDIAYMEKDGRKIKIYHDDFLVGIFYLSKQIQVEFLITWINQLYFRVVSINGVSFKSMVEKEKKKDKNYYELKLLSEEKKGGRKQIRIQTKDYREHMERIVSYAKESECLEIVFEEEGVGSVPLCINGVYLFGVSRIELDEETIELFLKLEKEQSQKEYKIDIRFGEKCIQIYKKHEMIYIVYVPYKVIGMPLSNKENLRLGHSFYQ
jgi:hypothetical protein